jgi:hypothetical protein
MVIFCDNLYQERCAERKLQAEGWNLKTTAKTPFPSSTYRPETDTSDKRNDEMSSRHYSQLIGALRLSIELGRINIYTETALLSQHLALPRVGHLEMVHHIFAHLSRHKKSVIYSTPLTICLTPRHKRKLIGHLVVANWMRSFHQKCQSPFFTQWTFTSMWMQSMLEVLSLEDLTLVSSFSFKTHLFYGSVVRQWKRQLSAASLLPLHSPWSHNIDAVQIAYVWGSLGGTGTGVLW